LVYKGPGLIGGIKSGLLATMRETGVASLKDAVGRDAAAIAKGDV
jgi:dihydroorotate dehydrogenase